MSDSTRPDIIEAARLLRYDGYSISKIATELHVPTSVVIKHTSDIELTKEQKRTLKNPDSNKCNALTSEELDNKRQYTSKAYAKNKEIIKARVYQRRHDLIEWFESLRSTFKCERCPEPDVCCYEFHHIDPNIKEDRISSMVGQGCSKERILAEIQKCIVLCANCHRKLHYYERHPERLAINT